MFNFVKLYRSVVGYRYNVTVDIKCMVDNGFEFSTRRWTNSYLIKSQTSLNQVDIDYLIDKIISTEKARVNAPSDAVVTVSIS